MGIGDKDQHFHPPLLPVMDTAIGKPFAQCSVRECPHPKVRERYGTGGVATVSVYTCKRCRYAIRTKYFGGYECEYGKVEKRIQAAEGCED